MRPLINFALAGILVGLPGCNEFVGTNEPVTAIDVVGDPSDPVSDSMEPADILGSAMPDPDDSESLTDLHPNNAPSAQPEKGTDQLLPSAGPAITKPVSLKKSTNQGRDSSR